MAWQPLVPRTWCQVLHLRVVYFLPPSLSGGSGAGTGSGGYDQGTLRRWSPFWTCSRAQPLAAILQLGNHFENRLASSQSPWHPLHRVLVRNRLHPAMPVIPGRVTPSTSCSKTVCNNVFTEVMASPFPYLICIPQEQLKTCLLNPLADRLLRNSAGGTSMGGQVKGIKKERGTETATIYVTMFPRREGYCCQSPASGYHSRKWSCTFRDCVPLPVLWAHGNSLKESGGTRLSLGKELQTKKKKKRKFLEIARRKKLIDADIFQNQDPLYSSSLSSFDVFNSTKNKFYTWKHFFYLIFF